MVRELKILKTVAVILGIFGMICSLGSFVGGFLIMSPFNELKLPPWSGLMATFAIILSFLKGVSHIFLINGALKEDHYQIKIWMVMDNITTLCISIFFGCYIHMMLATTSSFLLLGSTLAYYTIIWIVFFHLMRNCGCIIQENLIDSADQI